MNRKSFLQKHVCEYLRRLKVAGLDRSEIPQELPQ